MKLFWTLLVFGLAFQLGAFLFWAFDVCPLITYPMGDVQTVTSTFSIDAFDLMFTGAGIVAIGLAGLLLRQGTYAVYAMLIWAIGTIIPVVSNFFLAIPNVLGALIPAETNPNPELFVVHPLVFVIVAVFAFAAYWWLFELVTQRPSGGA